MIPVLAVVGVGLIGGSFGAALRAAGQVGRIIGVGRSAASLQQARELGLIDEVLALEEAAAAADVIMLSTPVGAMPDLLAQIAPHLREHTIITDGGSTKLDVVSAARAGLGERVGCFVPGHPMAGSERSGPSAADAGLFHGRTVVLTPLAENRAEDVALIRQAWDVCGAHTLDLPAAQHDRVLASVSHLPHFLAFAYMAQVAAADDVELRLRIAGPGFRDFSRIAGSSAEMWRDIFFANREAMLHELDAVQDVLAEMAAALRADDAAKLEAMLEAAAGARRRWGRG